MYEHRRKTLLNNGHLQLVFISGSARCTIISHYVSKDLGCSFLFKFELDPVRNRHCTRTSNRSQVILDCHVTLSTAMLKSLSVGHFLFHYVGFFLYLFFYFKITTISLTSLIFLVIFLWASELLVFKYSSLNRKDFAVKPKMSSVL